MATTIYNFDSYWLYMNSINNFTSLQKEINHTSNLISHPEKNYIDLVAHGLVEQADSAISNSRVTDIFIQDNAHILSRVNEQGSQLGLMKISYGKLASSITSYNVITGDAASFIVQMKSISDSVENMLNYSNGSGYVFSGNKTNIQPVQNATANTTIVNNTPTSNYYKGNDDIRTAQVSKYQNISYGITADNDAFVQFFAAVHKAIDGAQNKDSDSLDQAKAYIETAITELGSLIEVNMGVGATLQDLAKNMGFQKINYDTLAETTIKADPALESTRLKMLTTILEMSYSTYARISSLSLASHLAHR